MINFSSTSSIGIRGYLEKLSVCRNILKLSQGVTGYQATERILAKRSLLLPRPQGLLVQFQHGGGTIYPWGRGWSLRAIACEEALCFGTG